MNKQQVKQFLQERNLRPIKKLGQNFLIHPYTIQKLAKAVRKKSPPFVEIGPGLGALSRCFADKKKEILLIERDKKLADYWKSQGYRVLSADILRMEWKALPDSFTLFGNLPYNISGRLILKSCLYQKQVRGMIFMMQKELAQRVTALPPDTNYGLISVLSQTFWRVSRLIDVSREDFYPVPKVDGRVLEFQARRACFLRPELFLKFVKQCFVYKRKMLFRQIPGLSLEKAKKALKSLNLSETCRAEELSPRQFVDLYQSLSV